MASSTTLFPFLSIVALALLATAYAHHGFSVELIHHDHPRSPSYNPTLSPSDRIQAEIQRSNARAASLRAYFSYFHEYHDGYPSTYPPPSGSQSPCHPPNSPHGTTIQADLFASTDNNYYMSIRLGTPVKEIIAVPDTGSYLIWVGCEPCPKCYKKDPLFNPATSSSYTNLPCDSKPCSQLTPQRFCVNSTCTYYESYGQGIPYVIGDLAQETFTFKTTSGSFVRLPGLVFGCTHITNGTSQRNTAGIVGLGGHPLSLVSQLGSSIEHRFSYCLVPSSLTKVMTSHLNFGSDAVVSGAQTISMIDNGRQSFYAVTLDGITVGNNSLGPINSTMMIVDCGSTLTSLHGTVLERLVDALKKTISLPQVEDGQLPLCFNESTRSDYGYPDIILQLGTATITLKPYNAFLMINNHVRCLAMKPNDNFSILGNIAQQNFHIGFDLASWKISFAAADCTKN
ncbi:hypothetical protein LUZ62_062345 [Rhynchospora pubera]|uniref:Peptidase A1 domain-containing protein n=1 Tax=Rhynchospora pubera TaxID=906938 RepID=A0AAV8EI11_9POAL|nr:hypothetical protein LUZ62_062345 [Rhynchospora pubera]